MGLYVCIPYLFIYLDKVNLFSVSADIFYTSTVATIFVPSTTTPFYVRNSICALYNYNPPLSRTREPDTEDNELQADLRRKRAEAAAINGEDILSRIGLTQVYYFARCFLDNVVI